MVGIPEGSSVGGVPCLEPRSSAVAGGAMKMWWVGRIARLIRTVSARPRRWLLLARVSSVPVELWCVSG